MMSDAEALAHLQQLLDELRAEWHAAGRAREFETIVQRYRADGIWPFD